MRVELGVSWDGGSNAAPSVRITRRATFAAGHILCRPEWTEERNKEVFGACSSEHGHNYVIEATLEGRVDPETGMIANLKDIDAVLKRDLISKVDHRHMNRDVDFMRGVVPTAENIALEAWKLLRPRFEPARLVRLRVVESENNSAEVVAE